MDNNKSGYQELKKNVYLTGCTSFFTDVSSEMIYPILVFFLKGLLGATAPMFLGIIEGVAESTAAFSKVYFGRLADRIKKYKSMAIAGYGMSAAVKILLVIAGAWWHVLIVRFLDRIGKGLRSAPRDAILSESVPAEKRGWGFGFHRAMDHLGAVGGALIAYLLLRFILKGNAGEMTGAYRNIFAISLIPAFVALIFLFFVAVPKQLSEVRRLHKTTDDPPAKISKGLRLFLAATAIFAFGNSSNLFLIMRSTDIHIGFGEASVLLLYAGYSAIASIFSTIFGKISDRVGRKKTLLMGYGLYMAVYLSFGIFKAGWIIIAAWLLYGLYAAMTEGVEKAFISDSSSLENRGYALGLFSTIVGAGVLPANLIAGVLYIKIGPAAPFIFGGVMALVAWIIIMISVTDNRRTHEVHRGRNG